MNNNTIAAIRNSLDEIETAHPELYAVIARIAEAFSCAEIDPESELAEPAGTLVKAFEV